MFHCIPGHCGIRGNEEADATATREHNLNEPVAVPFSTYDASCFVRRFSTSRCSLRWREGASMASHLGLIDSGLKFRIPQQIPRYIETFLHRLRLGVRRCHQFLHRINKDPSPNCPLGGEVESAEHLLLKGSKHSTQQQTLQLHLAILDRRPLTLQKLLGPWSSGQHQRRAIAFFCFFLRRRRQRTIDT